MSTAPTFMQYAPCAQVDPDLMFPHPQDRRGVAAAKSICAVCEFTAECLARALSPETRAKHGVFGGKSEHERREIQRGRPVPLDYGPIPPKHRRIAHA
ncbi:WhiB family transcriptional regulator [Streptomyces pseudogriseolus]|uniref:WhiB family transcriptional regulator n=1 Tax=Streptomyces pseudogriseolus TaxID=36817 RepID=UPI000A3AA8E5